MRALTFLLFVCLAVPGAESLDPLRLLFDYDAKAPLDVKESLLQEKAGVSIYDVSYESPKGGRVTAFLVAPGGKGPFAGILFGHWGPGNRTEFLPEAELYAQAGAVCLLVNYPWTRPAPWRRSLAGISKPENDRDAGIQAVIDLRRGLDLLAARPGVDPKRLAYVGHSYGAQFGAIVSAVDRRPRAVVLVGGTPDQEAIYREGDDPDIVDLRTRTPVEQLDKYFQVMTVLSAVRYIPHAAPAPLLFQFARYERYFNEAAMKRYFAAASEPKTMRWYDTGHDLNDPQALADRAAWLEKKIGLKPVASILAGRIKSDLK